MYVYVHTHTETHSTSIFLIPFIVQLIRLLFYYFYLLVESLFFFFSIAFYLHLFYTRFDFFTTFQIYTIFVWLLSWVYLNNKINVVLYIRKMNSCPWKSKYRNNLLFCIDKKYCFLSLIHVFYCLVKIGYQSTSVLLRWLSVDIYFFGKVVKGFEVVPVY